MNRTFIALCRTLHIYLTMLALGVMLFFGITGFTAYHEDWFGATEPNKQTVTGKIAPEIARSGSDTQVIDAVRMALDIRGYAQAYEPADDEIVVTYKRPGGEWRATVKKADGTVDVVVQPFNFTARINDLHRGRYSGKAWGWVIDLSALLVVIACVTGLILWMALPRRRKLGIAAMIFGTAATLAVYFALVPGPDQHKPEAPPPAADQSSP